MSVILNNVNYYGQVACSSAKAKKDSDVILFLYRFATISVEVFQPIALLLGKQFYLCAIHIQRGAEKPPTFYSKKNRQEKPLLQFLLHTVLTTLYDCHFV